MKRRQVKQSGSEEIDFGDRILAATLAPLVFNFSVFIVLAVVFRHSHRGVRFLSGEPVLHAATVVLVLVPAIAGFMFGTNGVVNFLGHSFYTHAGSTRDLRKTVAIWIAILVAAYAISTGYHA